VAFFPESLSTEAGRGKRIQRVLPVRVRDS
jgi:hypothetical protein